MPGEYRTKSGIYCPNTNRWTDEEKHLITLGNFTWAVCRTDCSVSDVTWLKHQGIEIIMQLPDFFADHCHFDPGTRALLVYRELRPFTPLSHYAVLDNEPNLHQDRCRDWFAEQFCRWYRSVVATFRFYDPGSMWKLIFPGLCLSEERNWRYWLQINQENIRESYAVGMHPYWQGSRQMVDRLQLLGSPKLSYLTLGRSLFCLEYGNSLPGCGETEKITQYTTFINALPEIVTCANLFIAGGTEDWRHFWLTPNIATALSEI